MNLQPSVIECALSVLYDKHIISWNEYAELVGAEHSALAVARGSGFEQTYRDEQHDQLLHALRKLVEGE